MYIYIYIYIYYRQVSLADEADPELGTETPREATLFNVNTTTHDHSNANYQY